MLTKINKIKNLGLVFQDYTRPASLLEFKQANIFYGWNGCGKTTFSRLFDALGGNATFPSLEYDIDDDGGTRYRQNDTFPEKIRVFNQDYIANNVKILEGHANSFSILLGEENKELIEQVDTDRKLLSGDPATPEIPGKIAQVKTAKLQAKQKSTASDEQFTAIAKTIGTAMGGNALRDYRRPQAEADFAKLTEKDELSVEDLEENLQSAKQEALPAVNEIALPAIEIDDKELAIPAAITQVNVTADSLLSEVVQTTAVQRLTDNVDVSNWVETGLAIHKAHDSKDCEYCGQTLPQKRLDELASHFNEADRSLKAKIDVAVLSLSKIRQEIESTIIPDVARFYPNIHKQYDADTEVFTTAKTDLLKAIDDLTEELKAKKAKTTEKVIVASAPNASDFTDALEKINAHIEQHNITTTDFAAVRTSAIGKLKNHYLSSIFDHVSKLKADEKTLLDDISTLDTEIKEIQARITDAMAQISSDHKACDHINEKLAMFLGHTELQFKPHLEKVIDENGDEQEVSKGYDIMRGENLATNLSEGEKTAIAFVYFVVHLGDQEFDVATGIIVIDDPISSLDSNSLYQAFSFLKNAVRGAGQFFILTHNFDFLKLLINWRRGDRRTPTGHFMIKNRFENDLRCAHIEKMDRELVEYESEYHYLFKLLKQLRDEHDDSIAKAYPIPNIARKVWDTFTMFSVPNGQTAYKKVEELKTAGYDENKLDAIYKFINDQSHITGSGFDPALVAGTKKAVKDMLEMMNTISPDHFRIIDNATN